ncbi:MAG: hypothetical protein CUN55_16245, partial [Phototrophicales bacterium]
FYTKGAGGLNVINYVYTSNRRILQRIEIFRAFELGPSAEPFGLYSTLNQYLEDYDDIFIVASPLSGSSIVGDIAALIRILEPNQKRIFAFLAYDNNQRDPNWLASVYEVGRLSTPPGVRTNYWMGPGLEYKISERSALIDAFLIFPDGINQSKVSDVVWGMLVSEPLRKKVYDALARRDVGDSMFVPSVSICNSNAYEYPIGLLRDLYFYQVMLDLIEHKPSIGRISGRVDAEPSAINQALDQVRAGGLLPSLMALKEHIELNDKKYLEQLTNLFTLYRQQYEQKRRNLISELNRLSRE